MNVNSFITLAPGVTQTNRLFWIKNRFKLVLELRAEVKPFIILHNFFRKKDFILMSNFVKLFKSVFNVPCMMEILLFYIRRMQNAKLIYILHSAAWQ